MKTIFIRLGSISAFFCFGLSQAVTQHYYVRNDSPDPLLIGLYNIDAQDRILNPDNTAYLLAPKTKTSEGQSARLISIEQPGQVSQQFIFSKSINDMVKTVVQHLSHPLVLIKPISFNENKTPMRYYRVYPDVETYDEKVGGVNLVLEPLEKPIVGNQARLKLNLKKEDDVRRADALLAKALAAQATQKAKLRAQQQQELRVQKQQEKKAEQLLKKQVLEEQYQIRPTVIEPEVESETALPTETSEPAYQYGAHYHIPEAQPIEQPGISVPVAATALQAQKEQRVERHRRFSATKRRESVGIRPQREAVEGEVVSLPDPFALLGEQPEEESVVRIHQ